MMCPQDDPPRRGHVVLDCQHCEGVLPVALPLVTLSSKRTCRRDATELEAAVKRSNYGEEGSPMNQRLDASRGLSEPRAKFRERSIHNPPLILGPWASGLVAIQEKRLEAVLPAIE